jgi:hypothetical protein
MKYLLVLITLAISSCQPAYAADIRPALVHTFGSEGGFQKMPGDSGNYAHGKLIGTKYEAKLPCSNRPTRI